MSFFCLNLQETGKMLYKMIRRGCQRSESPLREKGSARGMLAVVRCC